MAAFSSAGQLRRRPAPVNTSMRRSRSDTCISSEIDICRSSKPAPNVTPHAQRRKVQPRGRLLFIGPFSYWIFVALCARLALQSARACYHLTSVGRLALKSCSDGVINLFQPDELQLIARVFRDVFVIPPVA